jgi:hypothetical protein
MSTERNDNPYSSRLAFSQSNEHGQPSGITLIAKYDESKTLITTWNTYKTLQELKLVVEQQYGANVTWDDQTGITPDSIIRLDSDTGRAEIHMQTTKVKNLHESIGMIKKLASETVMDGVVFPEDFVPRLETYVTKGSKFIEYKGARHSRHRR